MKRFAGLLAVVCCGVARADAVKGAPAVAEPIPELVPMPKPELQTETFVLRWSKVAPEVQTKSDQKYLVQQPLDTLTEPDKKSTASAYPYPYPYPGLMAALPAWANPYSDFGSGTRKIPLPDGVESWKIAEDGRSFTVRGTAKALKEVRDFVPLIDKAIEVKLAFYTVSTEVLDNVKTQLFNPPVDDDDFHLHFNRQFRFGYFGHKQEHVFENLIQTGQLKLVKEGTYFVFNNITRQIIHRSTETVQIPEGTANAEGNTTSARAIQRQTNLGVSMALGLNHDNTITAVLHPIFQIQTIVPDRVAQHTVQKVATVPQGQVMVIAYPVHPEKPQERVLCVLTPSVAKEKPAAPIEK